jgi:energy-coupling factor transport system ATP-binding protein
MTDLLRLSNLTFTYRGAEVPALEDLSIEIPRGQFVGLLGHTGAGKSTLIRCAAGIVPQFYKGKLTGEVAINGASLKGRTVAQLAGTVGTVFQDFESQLFSTNARLECAFPLENLGLDRDTMKARIEKASAMTGVTNLLDRDPQTLSGGQKQRLALASVLCMEPELLLCDEPTTDLDPVGKRDLHHALDEATQADRSVILSGHDAERMLDLDRLLVLNSGKLVAEGKPSELLADSEFCKSNRIDQPPLFALFAALGRPERPTTIDEAAALLAQTPINNDAISIPRELTGVSPLIHVEDLGHAYTPDRNALNGVSLDIHSGEFVAILGSNGSGKTTLVKHFNGLLTPTSGSVTFRGEPVGKLGAATMGRQVGFVFQNPDHMLFAPNVHEEVAFGLRNFGVPEKELDTLIGSALETVGLSGSETRDPFVMTKGERQKLAVACVLACSPEVLILDEPTTGLDPVEQRAMMELLSSLNRAGHTVVIVTHSVGIAAAYARRIVLLAEGEILESGANFDLLSKDESLARSGLVAPTVVTLGKRLRIPALTVNNLVEALS